MALILSPEHLAPELDKRRLKVAYIVATVAEPDWTELEPRDPALTRSYKAIPDTKLSPSLAAGSSGWCTGRTALTTLSL
jgi:hypothetical protein